MKGPGAPGRGCNGVAPAGMGAGSGGITGRGIDVTRGIAGVENTDGVDARPTSISGSLPTAGADSTTGIAAGAGVSWCTGTGTGAASTSDSVAARDARPGMRGMVIGSGTGAIGRTGVGGIDMRGVNDAGGAVTPLWTAGAAIEMTPPHTEQRARTPTVGTFEGSTRKTDRQSGHETFTAAPPQRWPRRAWAPEIRHRLPPRHRDGRW
ncbi:MAG: hypothetical protein NTW72_11270 [Gemmatimonadetes bacterium]|nr:hypothetical protein [Gemmatimonadota bacterium]